MLIIMLNGSSRDTNQEYFYKLTASISITPAPCSREDFTDNVPKKPMVFFNTAEVFFNEYM